MRRSVLHKTNNYLITVPTQPKLAAALAELGILGDAGLSLGIDPALVKQDCCAIAYLRGAFLGGGFVADPHGDFHFELTAETEQLAEDLVDADGALRDRGARRQAPRDLYAVYLKGAEPIVTFLALVGAHRALLRTEDVRIVKSMRNDVNRLVNAEIANQQKTAEAAIEQIEAISALARRAGLDNLPPALRELAELRLANPDVSLRELGELADPPLSKSAVYHRVRRIEELRRGRRSCRGVAPRRRR